MSANPALIGKAGEVLVAGELMRRGIEVAYTASDRGIDILAYRLATRQTMAASFVPIQVKARAKTGYNFQRSWFDKVPGVVLVHVWNLATTPEFYIFDGLAAVEDALGPTYAKSPSWLMHGGYNVTVAQGSHYSRMRPHRDKWDRITDRLNLS
jgi:hypothetical protein